MPNVPEYSEYLCYTVFMGNLVTVTSCASRIEAEIVKGKLEVHGIPSVILADDAGGLYPFPGQAGFAGVLVRVAKKDFIMAKKLLSEKF